MGLENPVHLIFIGIVALLVLGPRRLPELARAAGRGLREFREAMSLEGHEQAEPPAEPPAHAASAPVQVDPGQPVRSGDAPDRGPL